MPKETATEIGCGSFDQPDLQWLNNYIFAFSFCNCNYNFWGEFNIRLERYFQDLSKSLLQAPQIPNISVAKPKKTNTQSCSDCKLGWSKELRPISVVVLFGIDFY
jgi:hypothetical protein